MTVTTISMARFRVTASAIVESARCDVSSGQWGLGLQSIKDMLTDFSFDDALSVIRGDKTIIENEDGSFDLIDDNDSSDYKQEVREVYIDDCFACNDKLYKYVGMIESRDFDYMMEAHGLTRGPHFGHDEMFDAANKYMIDTKTERLFRFGSDRFMIAKEENWNTIPMWFKKTDFARSAEECYNVINNITPVVAKKPEPKQEVESKKNDGEMESYLKNIRLSYLQRMADEKGYEGVKSMTEDMRSKVLKACSERNVTWKEITINKDGTEIVKSVPVELAYAYITRDSKIWNPVCESGLKMEEDSAFHSDLWLAMGYELNGEEYNYKNPETNIFYDMIDNMRFNYQEAGDFSILNDAKMTKFSGKIVFENSKEITDKDILVLPNANLKYEAIAKKAGVVITERGGPVSHLVIVGREDMFPVLIMKDALSVLKDYENIEIDFINKSIKGYYGYKSFH